MIPTRNQSVPIPYFGRHMRNLVPTDLPGTEFSPEQMKGLREKGTDEIGLEFSGLGLFHLFPDMKQIFHAHDFFGQGVSLDDLSEMIRIKRTIPPSRKASLGRKDLPRNGWHRSGDP